jgi:hypothetical protein
MFFVARRPVAAMAVVWLLLLAVTPAVLSIRNQHLHAGWWATAVILAAIALSFGGSWYYGRKLPEFIISMAVLPWLVALELAFGNGAAAWPVWVALMSSGVQFGWYAWRRRATGPGADP